MGQSRVFSLARNRGEFTSVECVSSTQVFVYVKEFTMVSSRGWVYAACVLLTVTRVAHTSDEDVEVEEEETNPFFEAAKNLIQDQLQNNPNAQGFGAVGGMLTSFLQAGGGKQLGDMFAGATKNGNGNPTADIIAGIGSLVSAAQGGQNGGGGGWDPQMIGSMVSMFANTMAQNNDVDVNNNEVKTGGVKSRKQKQGGDGGGGGIDLESMLSLASTFMGQNQNGGGGGGGMEGLMNLLPMLMQGMGGNANTGRQNSKQGKEKASFLPPFLEHFSEYWQHFQTSELGQTLWRNSGLEGIVKLFTDESGRFDVDKIFKSLENPSFRRRWIKSLTSFVAEWVSHVADPATQARYLGTAQFVANSFLKAQGYNKAVLFDPARPAESLSLLVNAVFKRQFGLQVQSATYIKPAVAYMQDVFRIGQSKGLSLGHLTPAELESKMADTLNGEVIEPVLKVWRAYRFARDNGKCDKYVICVVNQVRDVGVGLKPGVTKLASLGASWFLSGQTETPFWKLYNAATENHDCDAKYSSPGCIDYHEFDVQTTTEYIHNEL